MFGGKSSKKEIKKKERVKKEKKKEEKTEKPGGGKGRSYFEVTMEVPGMQVSGKVDAVVHFEGFARCSSNVASKLKTSLSTVEGVLCNYTPFPICL